MSLKPGIAKNWYLQFKDDVYPADYVVLRGKKMRPPKYYDRVRQSSIDGLAEAIQFDEIIERRITDALKNLDNNTPERLAVREAVQIAQISKLVKTL